MDEPAFSLSNTRVLICGLGLMGSSLALALRGRCAGVLGFDPDQRTCQQALQRGIVDQASQDPEELTGSAGLVVLAAPVSAILHLLDDLAQLHPGNPVVLDLGSTKTQITQAMAMLPERFDPIGGHPMCGKERGTIDNAEAGLYLGAPFALTPLERTTRRARALAEQLARAVGAKPVWLDALLHDQWVAATSHVPYLSANALAASTPVQARPMVGPGFRSAARLAPTPRSMMMDILVTNRVNILSGLGALRSRLEKIESLMENQDWQALEEALAEGAVKYEALTEITKD